MEGQPRLRILYVSKRLPIQDAAHAGGQITHYYLRSVATWADVELLALGAGHESTAELPPSLHSFEVVPSGDLLSVEASTPSGLLARLVPYGRLLRRALRSVRSASYDLVVVERSALAWMVPLLRRASRSTPVLLVVHDFWFDRLRADAARRGPIGTHYFELLSRFACAIERWGLRSSQGILCYDERTKGLIGRLQGPGRADGGTPVLSLPPYYEAGEGRSGPAESRGICFYGNMSRSVNWRSAKWFIERVLPALRADVPEATFTVVGARPPEQLLEYHDGQSIVVTGFVDDPGSYLASAQVFVAPLLSGTGIKIKVLEAMASGVPVVANQIAMQGIAATAGRDYLHAESADEFVAHVGALLRDQVLRRRIGDSGRALVDAQFDLTDALLRQRRFIEQLARAGSTDDGLPREPVAVPGIH